MLIKYTYIFRYIKVQRVRLIGHIVRMYEERTVERITDWRQIAVRRIGGQRLRRKGDVRQEMGKTKIQDWSRMEKRIDEWPKLTKSCSAKRIRRRFVPFY